MSEERLHIDRIAAGGDGVARAADGIVVFVPRTAPGDEVVARVRRERRMARGRLLDVMTPGPDRVEPPCRHYTIDRCGGCQIQHLSYDAQLASKSAIIHDALRRIGGRAADAPSVRPSGAPWRYRRKLTLALRRTPSDWIAGLHPYDDPVGVFRLRDCPITDERVLAIWKSVLAVRRFFPPARMLRGAVRLLDAGGASFVLEGGGSWPEVRAFFDAVPALTELWWEPDGARPRLMRQRDDQRTGASFAQVNAPVAEELRAHLVDRTRAHAPSHVVDAYAGTGDTAAALVDERRRITAIEIDAEAAARCRERLPAGSTVRTGRVESVLPEVLPADLIVVNPPRSGLDERVTATIEAAREATVVLYVSCNPATLARDLARMPSYRLASVVGFDMFPQTAHVETVSELRRAGLENGT